MKNMKVLRVVTAQKKKQPKNSHSPTTFAAKAVITFLHTVMSNPLFTDDIVNAEFCEYLNQKLAVEAQFTSHTPVTGKGFQNMVHVLKNSEGLPVAVLRVFSIPVTATNEILCLTAMNEREITNGRTICPKVLFVETDNSHLPFSFMVQEFVAGDTLTRGDIHNEQFIRDAAVLLHEIHSVGGPPRTAEQIGRDAEFWPDWAVGECDSISFRIFLSFRHGIFFVSNRFDQGGAAVAGAVSPSQRKPRHAPFFTARRVGRTAPHRSESRRS